MIAAKVDAHTGEEGPRTHSNRRRASAAGRTSNWPPKNLAPLPRKPAGMAANPRPKKGKKGGKRWTPVAQDELFDRLRDQVRGGR